jgi:hypothetical protein
MLGRCDRPDAISKQIKLNKKKLEAAGRGQPKGHLNRLGLNTNEVVGIGTLVLPH